jgi:molecular chaperone HscA
MDSNTAAALLASLLERANRDQTLGSVSSLERQALAVALGTLGNERNPVAPRSQRHEPSGSAEEKAARSVAPVLPQIDLALGSLNVEAPNDDGLLMCLDFGTAMSKAFASSASEFLDLELGAAAGRQGYPLPSSVFIGDDGKAYFGYEAIELSQELIESGRERLDSIKGWLSLRKEGNLDGEVCVLQKSFNPTEYRLTQGDLIRIYLAYLTDIAERALAKYQIAGKNIGRYVKRRFARPCWPDAAQVQWADTLMRNMLAEAQILADTFSGRWEGGIHVAELKAAIEQIRVLGRRPGYLIDNGVPEPVAVAAGAVAGARNQRDAYMVVDVGAGTTDFGLFVAARLQSDDDEEPRHRVFQVPASIHGLMQAGDKVDAMLRVFITRKEGVDTDDISGKLITADLTRRIRSLKETLFKTGSVEYALADGTIGKVHLDEFLADERVERFAKAVEDGFKKSLESVNESWLRWLAMEGVRLHVVLTGGSSSLPMMQALARGWIEAKGFRIMRDAAEPRPAWMDDAPDELLVSYPQLAVAIGGAAEELPETVTGPEVFGGGGERTRHVIERMQVSGV